MKQGKLTAEGIRNIHNVTVSKRKLSKWIVDLRKSPSKATNKWGLQAPRIACALYLNDKQLLQPHEVGAVEDELRYEITIQVLDKVSKIEKYSSQEIATFINGLLVICLNPRDFHGYDLVAELRSRVETENYTNPFQILALCNANDTMTLKDIDRLELAFNSKKNRPLWFDTQAFSVLALNCIMRKNESLVNATSTLQSSMIQELVEKQASNGTVGSFKDTALVLQALIATNYSDKNFNVQAAIDSLLSMQQSDGSFGSFLNSYYIVPVLNSKSLIDIHSDHCQEPKMNEIEALDLLKRSRKNMLRTLLSVWIGSDTDLGKTWTLKVPVNSSFYDAIELISSMDSKFKVEYSISDGKPYVSSVSEIEDDPEFGLYWFTYVKISNSSMNANFVERSPADVIIEENQELILWYKEGM